MSTGKRLAKRSIVGTKVVVLREDGLYYPGEMRCSILLSFLGGLLDRWRGLYFCLLPGVIQAVKTAEVDPAKGQSVSITKYAVRSMMDGQRQQLREYSEVDLIGPGFQSTAGLTLQPGQKVYVTFTGREVAGHVIKHRPDVDQVHIALQSSNSVTLEEIFHATDLTKKKK